MSSPTKKVILSLVDSTAAFKIGAKRSSRFNLQLKEYQRGPFSFKTVFKMVRAWTLVGGPPRTELCRVFPPPPLGRTQWCIALHITYSFPVHSTISRAFPSIFRQLFVFTGPFNSYVRSDIRKPCFRSWSPSGFPPSSSTLKCYYDEFRILPT